MWQLEDLVLNLSSFQGGLYEDQSTASGHQSNGLLGSPDHVSDEPNFEMANSLAVLSSY
jgi:hypothetical protein